MKVSARFPRKPHELKETALNYSTVVARLIQLNLRAYGPLFVSMLWFFSLPTYTAAMQKCVHSFAGPRPNVLISHVHSDQGLENQEALFRRAQSEMGAISHKRDLTPILEYKNRPPSDYRPREVHLNVPYVPEWLRLRAISAMGSDSEAKRVLLAALEPYFQQVESLRQGDTVVFDASYDEWDNVQVPQRSFRLGPFISAGNSVHIFALADFAGRAIRLPYTKPRIYLVWSFGTEVYARTAPTYEGVRRIQIYQHQPQFAEVELVPGRGESSSTYVEALVRSQENGMQNSAELVKYWMQTGRVDDAYKLSRLIYLSNLTGGLLDGRRQWTFHEVEQDWVMTDWE